MKNEFTIREIIEVAKEVEISNEMIERMVRKLRRLDTSEMPLSGFNLTARTQSSLMRAGIATVEELKDFIEVRGIKGLKKIRNFGEVCYEDLKATFRWISKYEKEA